MFTNQNNQVITVNEFKILLNKLYEIQSQAYRTDCDFDQIVSDYLTENEKFNFEEFYKGKKLNVNSPESLQKAVEEYVNKLKNMDKLSITLSFEPNIKFLKNMCKSLENIMKSDLILDYQVDREIIGGAVLEFKGKYFKFLLKDMIEEVFGKSNFNLSITGEKNNSEVKITPLIQTEIPEVMVQKVSENPVLDLSQKDKNTQDTNLLRNSISSLII